MNEKYLERDIELREIKLLFKKDFSNFILKFVKLIETESYKKLNQKNLSFIRTEIRFKPQ